MSDQADGDVALLSVCRRVPQFGDTSPPLSGRGERVRRDEPGGDGPRLGDPHPMEGIAERM